MIREGTIQLPFRYAAGRAGSRFLAALRDEGRILASRCRACGLLACPARPFCPRCSAETPETTVAGPKGTLVAWTEVPGRAVFGLIRLDGADTAIFHRLIGPADRWAARVRVRPRFAAERKGSILDIEGFEPAEEADK